MNQAGWYACASTIAVTIALAFAGPAAAQQADRADASENQAANLEDIVVTAASGMRSQINSAVSVTNIKSDTIQKFQPASEAELLRLIPGIQTPGNGSPAGNANIAVRGLPVATGGSPFVQLQEDGLPTVLFGDIQFGNNDYWTRFDPTVRNVESVRGGSATTFASQAPGAVINYISDTGTVDGGYLQLTTGLGYDQLQLDFRNGGRINDTMRYLVGGYIRQGDGPRAKFNTIDSIYLKGNITKEFEKGYFRILGKYADTKEPSYGGGLAYADVSGLKISNLRPIPGFDARRDTHLSVLNPNMLVLNREGVLERADLGGIKTHQATIGAQFQYRLSDAISVNNNMRWSDISGAFETAGFNFQTLTSNIGRALTLNGQRYATVAQVRYANGPLAGQVYNKTFMTNATSWSTRMRDLGSFVNDLKLNAKFDTGLGNVSAQGGHFFMNQRIAVDWHGNRTLREISGENPALLDYFDAAGNRLSYQGVYGYNNASGATGARDNALNYRDQALYLGADLETSRFVFDASARREMIDASGWAISGGPEFMINSGGVNIPAQMPNGATEYLNYGRSYTTWTAGALVKLGPDNSMFLRRSRGARFNGDRQVASGKINADGSLNQAGQIAAVDFVYQDELGFKSRGDVGPFIYTAELTLTKGHFKQSTFEISQTRCPTGACIFDARFRAKSAEFFGTLSWEGFSTIVNATYSDSLRSLVDAAGKPLPFLRSPGLPDWQYTVASNYDFPNGLVTIGASVTGNSSIITDQGYIGPPGRTVNATLRVRPMENLEIGLDGYNLFNRYDSRGGGAPSDLTQTPALISAGSALGRTFSARIRYSF